MWERRVEQMPTLRINGVQYAYQEIGNGRETLVFAHGVLMNSNAFQSQMRDLSLHFRCIAFDWRGHGQSERPNHGYDVDTSLLSDALALLQKISDQPVHFIGVALGGFIGLRLALHYPEWLRSLTLLASAADAEPAMQVNRLVTLSRIARYIGIRPFARLILNAQFARPFLSDPAREADRAYWLNYLRQLPAASITQALIHEVQHKGIAWDVLSGITTPTLVIHGEEDSAIAWQRAQRTANAIPRAQFVRLPGVGHSPTIEAGEQITQLLHRFIVSDSNKEYSQ
jgi:3-oxoadipate enol-lactonase